MINSQDNIEVSCKLLSVNNLGKKLSICNQFYNDNMYNLGYLEAISVFDRYTSISLGVLRTAIKMQNKCDKLHNFLIVMPYCDRPNSLMIFLRSLENELKNFGYDTNHSIKLLIFEDGLMTPPDTAKLIENYSPEHFELFFISARQLTQFRKKFYPNDSKQKTLWHELFGLPEQAYKGPMAMANIAKLYLKKEFSKYLNNNTLICHIDSDQSFGIETLIEDNIIGVRDHVFDYFGNISRIFKNCDNIKMLSCKLNGDPPISPVVMTQTLLKDLEGMLTGKNIGFPQLAHYDNDFYPYYDLRFLQPLKNIITPNFYPELLDENHTSINFFMKLSGFFEGRHPTRPILYHPKNTNLSKITGVSRQIELTNIINPGNVIYRPEMLKHPYLMAKHKIRMGGPLLGQYISQTSTGLYRAFVPMRHQRKEFRLGVNKRDNFIDISNESTRQIIGDYCLNYLRTTSYFEILNNNFIADQISYSEQIYQKHRIDVLQQAESCLRMLDSCKLDRKSNEQSLFFAKNFITGVKQNFEQLKIEQILSIANLCKIHESISLIPMVLDYWKMVMEVTD